MRTLELEKSSYDEEDEVASLITGQLTSPIKAKPIRIQAGKSARRSIGWLVVAALAVGSFLALFWTRNAGRTNGANGLESKNGAAPEYKMKLPVFQCPSPPDNDIDFEDYGDQSSKILQNVTEYIKTYRNVQFDDWGRSYEEIKAGLYSWKENHYTDIKDGDSIYESACGIGLNLVMVLEILAETRQVSNITVYGNEYVSKSVKASHELLDKATSILPEGNHYGSICQGDSTNIDFVPSNAFDFVFTGYLSPLADPLGFGMSDKENYARYTEVCESNTDESKEKIAHAKTLQEVWYSSWVLEMIRIAKPGAPVVVEEVSYPYCEAQFDWDGVTQEFWMEGVSRFGWDVDPSSIVFGKDKIFTRRYHVFMRKNA